MAPRYFSGRFFRTIDERGRVVAPVEFRKILGSDCYVVEDYNNRECISIYPVEAWNKEKEDLLGVLDPFDEWRSALQSELGASSFYERIDAQGRIQIPPKLLEGVGIKIEEGSEIVMVGAHNRIEVWDVSRWNNRKITLNEIVKMIRKRKERKPKKT